MSWKRVCTSTDVEPDTVKRFAVEGVDIVMVNLGDTFRAYPPACPHMEEPLDESGICKGGTLTCTKHLWQWDMRTGQEQGPAEKSLLMYDVKQEGADVFVFIDKELEYEYDEDDDDDDDDDDW